MGKVGETLRFITGERQFTYMYFTQDSDGKKTIHIDTPGQGEIIGGVAIAKRWGSEDLTSTRYFDINPETGEVSITKHSKGPLFLEDSEDLQIQLRATREAIREVAEPLDISISEANQLRRKMKVESIKKAVKESFGKPSKS